jgi:hypothetical protein
MPEVVPGNALQSTLNGAITASATQLTIQSADAAAWPGSGTYRCVLWTDPTTGPFEIVTVTGGQGTATLTVTRASEPYKGTQTAQAWASGASIAPVVTQAALQALVSYSAKLIGDQTFSTDLGSATLVASGAVNTWVDLTGATGTFTVDDGGALIQFAAQVSGQFDGSGTAVLQGALRVLVDGGLSRVLGNIYTTGGDPRATIASTPVVLGQLTVGSHTWKLQVNYSVAGGARILCATNPNQHYLRAQTLQLSQGGGSSTAPLAGYEVTLVAAAASVRFPTSGSLPQNYRHIRLRWQARSDAVAVNTQLTMQFNGDTAANYDREQTYFQGTANPPSNVSGALESMAQTTLQVGEFSAASAPAGATGAGAVDILNYAGTTFRKDVLARSYLKKGDTAGASNLTLEDWVGEWRSTAAITSIVLSPAAGNFVAGSVFTLFLEGPPATPGAPAAAAGYNVPFIAAQYT